MIKKYCKLNDNNKIFEIKEITNNTAVIFNGNLYITTSIDNIQMIDKPEIIQNKRSYGLEINKKQVPNEIMLRHMTKDEAISCLDKYIDDALVAKLGRIKVIHGRHGGILRDAVHKYLKVHPYVKEFHIADYYEGGIGVTIAILRKK